MSKGIESIIKPHLLSPHESQAQRDWATVTGEEAPPPELFFENLRNGEEYYQLAIAIGWPGPDRQRQPGYCIVMGVERKDNPAIFCLEERSSSDITGLLQQYINLRDKYGFGAYSQLLKLCYGDPRLNSEIVQFNRGLPEHRQIILTVPYGFDRDNFFEIYFHRLHAAMPKDGKTLHLRDCQRLRNEILSIPPGKVANSDYILYPAVFAASALHYTLSEQKAWKGREGAYTIDEGFDD